MTEPSPWPCDRCGQRAPRPPRSLLCIACDADLDALLDASRDEVIDRGCQIAMADEQIKAQRFEIGILKPALSATEQERDALLARVAHLAGELERAADAWAWVEANVASLMPVMQGSGVIVGWRCGHVKLRNAPLAATAWDAVKMTRAAIDAAMRTAARDTPPTGAGT